ncbi:hypothetical protein ACIPX0_12335 [Streptomyces sp. NPDC090075]|uniref:hypothetical protein n=1 Tax=Streptomyces sp. NPDC090075 TaxID=3365937 RepID=UPI00380B932B
MSPVRALNRPTGRLSERALGLLADNGDSGMTAASVAIFLRVTTSSAEKVLRTLVARKLASRDGADPSGGGADLYRAVPQEGASADAPGEEQ